MTSILDLENSNLPIDYFTSVLPRAQYGEEGAVSVGLNNSDAVLRIFNPADGTKGVIVNSYSFAAKDNMQISNQAPVDTSDGHVSRIRTESTGNIVWDFVVVLLPMLL